MKRFVLVGAFILSVSAILALAQTDPNPGSYGVYMLQKLYNLATATPNSTPTWVVTPVSVSGSFSSGPQAIAAATMLPTPVGQGTPVVPASSGSGQQFCWPSGPRDQHGNFSVAVSLTTPVTVGTAPSGQFWDIGPSVLHNTATSSVSFSIYAGSSILWSNILDAGSYLYLPPLIHGGTGGQPYYLSIALPVTHVSWNGSYQVNGR